MNDLEKARQQIDDVDREMAVLFVRRMEAARQVAAYKKAHGLPVEDARREEEIIERRSKGMSDEAYRSYYVRFLRCVMDLSKKWQHRLLDGMRVAYSGVAGAFANIVASRIFPYAVCVPYGDFEAAYRAVENGECDCALLPIENSFNGDVGKVLDLAFFGSLFVNGVYEAEIVQNLLGVKGSHVEDVRQVISHPQALGQCAAFIEKHAFEPIEAVNTAVAAKQVADLGRCELAAIGSEEAAIQYGLDVLAAHINESSANTTRFAVFSRERRTPSPIDDRFLLLFTVKNVAGSLGQAISVIGQHGFNLRALKSRPTKELVWDYYFYAEGEGNIDSEQGKAMLRDLQGCCSHLKVLGGYEREQKI
ncbi:MAG: chorismate mutase [Clostridia bacterium]|nr:chorismate mutase [Clostridia bacterium]